MVWVSPKDAMPWVGLYVGVSSLTCILAMAADAVHAIWKWKLWFPNKFFTLNSSTITLIAIAMKIPVDLSTDYVFPTSGCDIDIIQTKMAGINFLVTMLANLLPSLGLMDDKELLMNIVALGILMITIVVNIGIQSYTHVLFLYSGIHFIFICASFLWPFSVALTVSASRKKLEHRYKESQLLVSGYQEKKFSSKGLRNYVKKYWMMTETRNPQFAIACSPVSSAFGVICLYISLSPIIGFIVGAEYISCDTSDYKWSLKIIHIVQSFGAIVGSIAPISRCLSSVGHYNLSKEWSKNHLNVFRVEKHWIQMLQKLKHRHIHSYIPGRHCKIVFHNVKSIFLNFCITLHVLVLVICKTICLVPRTILILLSYCWYLFKSCLEWFYKVASTPNSNESQSPEIKEYVLYVVQIEEDAKLSDRILRNTLRYITRLLDASEGKEPRNLMMLLEKSIGFNGMVMFENDKVQPLYHEETHNCWSLVIVTLTSVAIALPNITQGHVKSLLSSVREGLQVVRHIEECLNGDDDTLQTRKAAKHVWAEVEVYHSWLQINLQKMARKGKTSKEVLQWLGDEVEKIVREFKRSKKPVIDQSPYKCILASSMHKISRSMLLHINEQDYLNDEEIFEGIATMIADILSACFTNLPRVIKLKCHHHAIEKRGESIRNAAELLGKCKKVLKILKARQLPNMDPDSMAYMDKWRVVVLQGQIRNDNQIRYGGASSTMIEPTSSSCNEQLIVSVM
ncbi:hypothetical protein SSX86_012503 [Deinandra increscens subsp. villosa]|uniref:Uncharacterized protein n=1 Tax=Deinandra increscens subsp. villosa TaxID=3103831 RepID=A0AAP0D8S9_9ASTR